LESLDPQITEDIATKIIERRDDSKKGGPYHDTNDFYSYLQGLGVRTDDMQRNQVPLIFDSEYNFRITSIGTFRNVRQTIEVVTYDIDSVTSRYVTILNQNDQAANQGNSNQTQQNQNNSNNTKT